MSWITHPLKKITLGEVVRGGARRGKKSLRHQTDLGLRHFLFAFSHISASALVISAQREESRDGPCCAACFCMCAQWPSPQQGVTRSPSHLSWVRFPESRHWRHIGTRVWEAWQGKLLGWGRELSSIGQREASLSACRRGPLLIPVTTKDQPAPWASSGVGVAAQNCPQWRQYGQSLCALTWEGKGCDLGRGSSLQGQFPKRGWAVSHQSAVPSAGEWALESWGGRGCVATSLHLHWLEWCKGLGRMIRNGSLTHWTHELISAGEQLSFLRQPGAPVVCAQSSQNVCLAGKEEVDVRGTFVPWSNWYASYLRRGTDTL